MKHKNGIPVNDESCKPASFYIFFDGKKRGPYETEESVEEAVIKMLQDAYEKEPFKSTEGYAFMEDPQKISTMNSLVMEHNVRVEKECREGKISYEVEFRESPNPPKPEPHNQTKNEGDDYGPSL